MMSPEWTLYNILQLRFLENRKVREVARRLSMSEADLYRKQRVAILAVTDLILKQEQALENTSHTVVCSCSWTSAAQILQGSGGGASFAWYFPHWPVLDSDLYW